MSAKRSLKKCLAVLITAVMMLVPINAICASAAAYKSGYCNVGYLDVYSQAGGSGWLGYLDLNDRVSISDEKTVGGKLWYKITWEYLTGYVTADQITVTADSPAAPQNELTDDEFETFMINQRFPDSYKPYLRQLHKAHPKWIFTAQQLGIDWNRAVSEECVIGRNLVHSGAPASWKSVEKGAYDAANGYWYELDSGGWVAASSQIIMYYLDPRNFLTDDFIFMFENLSYNPSVQTAEGVRNILAGSFMEGQYTCPDTGEVLSYPQTFIDAAEVSGVSPYHLASRCLNEQGYSGVPQSWGTVSGWEGYFNFFDIQAYATSYMSAAQMGAKYASTYNPDYLLPWTNQYRSIIGGSIFLGNGFIDRDQDTLYLQKFDMTDGGNGYFMHQYMTCVFGQANEALSLRNAYSSAVLDSAIEFKIPVYDNMPESICPKPTSVSDNNNFLSSLYINGVDISPDFNMYNYDYTAKVSADTEYADVRAYSQSFAAQISGTGYFPLSDGSNVINVTCTSGSGAQRVYTITVERPASGKKVLKGDVSGDGRVDVMDALYILRYTAGEFELSQDQLTPADLDSNGSVDVVDALTILRQISE